MDSNHPSFNPEAAFDENRSSPEVMFLPSFSELVASLDPQRKEFLDKLPVLTEADLAKLGHTDSSCPICYIAFLDILAEEEMASAMDSPAVAAQDMGVTRLQETCGHAFCRKDISIWIRQNDTCPTCRTPFMARPDTTLIDPTLAQRSSNVPPTGASLNSFGTLDPFSRFQRLLQMQQMLGEDREGMRRLQEEFRTTLGAHNEGTGDRANDEEDDRTAVASMFS